jgi:NAD-dependent dihydropyrimidine dehydrogenase PreA subunit
MAVRKIIRIDEALCTGCGDCVIDCAEGALKIVGGKARVVRDAFCDGLGACLGACPTGALTIEEREAEAFDEEAVEAHLHALEASLPAPSPTPFPALGAHAFGGCPGSRPQVFAPAPAALTGGSAAQGVAPRCELTQWPIQLRLLPTDGPLYAQRDLLLLADCVPATDPDVQRGLIRGRTIALTCPKLDDPRPTVEKLARIFQNPVRSITVAIMEVPCCGGLVAQVQQALAAAGKNLPVQVVVVGLRGEVRERTTR